MRLIIIAALLLFLIGMSAAQTPLDAIINDQMTPRTTAISIYPSTTVIDLQNVSPGVFASPGFFNNNPLIPRFTDNFDLLNYQEMKWIANTNQFLQQETPLFAPTPVFDPENQGGPYAIY